jgi:hypothetical protein
MARTNTIQGGGGGGDVVSVNGQTGVVVLTKANIGLGNVDNTSDANKPISTLTQTALNLKEDLSNKSSTTSLGTSNTLYPTQGAVKTYVDGLFVGVFNYRGAYDASGNTFPATGGSGGGGAIQKGDIWIISVAGTLGGNAVVVGDSIIASVDTPGQTAGNWNILEGNISYVPEDVANKVDNFLSPNNTTYPTTEAVVEYITSNPENFLQNITGLVSAGTDITITGTGTVGDPFVIDADSQALTGTATEVVYFDASGDPTSDSLFTRDATTLFTNISTPINSGDDTVSILSGEIEPFPGSPLPGVGLQYSAPGDDRTTIFGLVDGTVFGAGKAVFAGSAQNTANGDVGNIIVTPEVVLIAAEAGTGSQYSLNINQSALNMAYVDDIDSPTLSFGFAVNEFGLSVEDYIQETNWYIGLIPGTANGQVFTWDNATSTGIWTDAAVTFDSVTGNLWSVNNENVDTRNFSVTLGFNAGIGGTNASELIAIGVDAGNGATDAESSIFIGSIAGYTAANATDSVFIGNSAGSGATNAANSILIGQNTGSGAVEAANSIFIGRDAGENDTVDNNTVPGYSILIGDTTSTGGNSNSVAIGSGATNTAPNEFLVQSPTSPFLYGNFDFNESVRIGDLSSLYTDALLEMNLNPGSVIGYTRAMFNFDRVTLNSRVAEQIQTVALDNGDTAIIDNAAYASNYIIRPDGGSIASGTVELPAVPQQGDMINLLIEGTITALTIDPGTNAVAGTLPTTVTTYDSVQLIYLSDASTWYVKN